MKTLIVALLALALTGDAASATTTFGNGPMMAVSATVAHAQRVRRDLDLVNHSVVTVLSFFASNDGTDHWDVGLLGDVDCRRITLCSLPWMVRLAFATTTPRWCSSTEQV